MARTSMVISIAFTGFIMLSIAQMALGVSRVDLVVGALVSGPSETAKVGRDGEISVDLENGQVNTNGHTGVNAAGGLLDANRNGNTGVDLQKGQVNKGGETTVTAANGLVDVKKGKETAVKVGNVSFGLPENKNAAVPENSYPANKDMPATKNTKESYN
ncbi:uncharacterized protein LOC113326907 [Papaver somniferum]|uniref:uncharacterized protein LOC113326907 n=1 Tax=Papaver somniferum TaxID=3469 RepID=UPI000E701035|nr:uncharacterized protein LOC113326907 [Papaver somniferum]